MKTLTNEELRDILDQHALWLKDSSKGKRADLNYVNLRDANLSGIIVYKGRVMGLILKGKTGQEWGSDLMWGFKF